MSRTAPPAKILAGCALAIAIVVGGARPAAAHADLVSSDPPTGTALATAPSSVRLEFTEPVDPTFSRVLIRGTGGRNFAPNSVVVAPGDNRGLYVGLPHLTNGPYAITWTTTTTDGHTSTGDVVIGIGPVVNFASVGPAQPVGEGAGLRRASTAARAIWYLALCLFVAALLWSSRLLLAGWITLVTVSLARASLLIASLAAAAPQSTIGDIISRLRPSIAGRAWFVLIDVVIIAGLFVRRRARVPLLVAVPVICIAEAATGHAALGPVPVLVVGATAVHLMALGVWGGGLIVVVTLLGAPREKLVGFLHRFSPAALASVAALFATGGVMAWIQLGGLHALTGSRYGHTLIVKLALVTAILPLGLWHWRSRLRPSLGRTAALELALVTSVVTVASLLASLAPGRDATHTAVLAASGRPTSPAACTSTPIETASCWEAYFTYAAKHRPIPAVIDEINRIGRKDEIVKGECHQLTHTVGRMAMVKLGSASSALRYSSPLCNSGYQHGVIEEAISKLTPEQLRAALPTFCTPITYRPYSFDHHNCAHGVGHGIATHLKEDVFASTPFCEVLTDEWETQSCYGGVFMQKVIGDINGASKDDHPDDPVWPCDVVPEIQKDACYLISTGRVLRLLDNNWKATFAVCDSVEAPHDITCYESIGRDASGFTLFEPQKIVDICMQAGKLGPAACIRGATQTTVDNDHNATRATKLCGLVPDQFKDGCRRVRDDSVAQL